MELVHIAVEKLSVSRANMRHARKAPDISDILPSVRARGILVPLLVRPNGSEDSYEIVAGRRRYHAALALADEGSAPTELPCAVMEPGDNAAAIEASLIENVARLNPDEVTLWETFTKMVKAGRHEDEIATTFGMLPAQVRRILALGNLLPGIRALYRREEIDPATIRHLTLASRARQQEWLTLWRDPGERAPTGQQVKHWLFGGRSIAASVALFPLESYAGELVTDLFGEERYFADGDAFWTAQMAAVAERRTALLAEGWSRVDVLERGEPFYRWQYEQVAKSKGGAVFITVSEAGQVEVHEGWLSRKEAANAARGDEATPPKPARPELTAPLKNYLDLHRHAAVRMALLATPQTALRLIAAQLICGSSLWSVRADPERAHTDEIAESVAHSASARSFAEQRKAALRMVGTDTEALAATGSGGASLFPVVFRALQALCDEDVLALLALLCAETLEAGSDVIDELGVLLEVDIARAWQADGTLYDLLRDRRIVNALLAEVAGDAVAEANAAATLKVQKAIIRDCLAGTNGRERVEGWIPRWLRFPAGEYLSPAPKESEPT